MVECGRFQGLAFTLSDARLCLQDAPRRVDLGMVGIWSTRGYLLRGTDSWPFRLSDRRTLRTTAFSGNLCAYRPTGNLCCR